jgi:hypothetical protein
MGVVDSGVSVAEAVTSMLYTKSAAGTEEIVLGMDNTAYHVITTVGNTTDTASANDDGFKITIFGYAGADPNSDTGQIAGFGRVDGRDVGVVVNDFTTKGSSTSATNSRKMGYIRKVCTEKGMPFLHIGESTGARLPDAMARGMGAVGNDITQFRALRNADRDRAGPSLALDWLTCLLICGDAKRDVAVSSPRLFDGARRKSRPTISAAGGLCQ